MSETKIEYDATLSPEILIPRIEEFHQPIAKYLAQCIRIACDTRCPAKQRAVELLLGESWPAYAAIEYFECGHATVSEFVQQVVERGYPAHLALKQVTGKDVATWWAWLDMARIEYDSKQETEV